MLEFSELLGNGRIYWSSWSLLAFAFGHQYFGNNNVPSTIRQKELMTLIFLVLWPNPKGMICLKCSFECFTKNNLLCTLLAFVGICVLITSEWPPFFWWIIVLLVNRVLSDGPVDWPVPVQISQIHNQINNHSVKKSN